jgi:hypothetical protein
MAFLGWTGWPAMLSIATVVLATATTVLAGGLVVGWKALGETRAGVRETQKATRLDAYGELFREYRSPEMLAARKRILSFTYDCKLERLPLRDCRMAEMVSNYLDQIGTFVKLDDLAFEPSEAFLGGSALNMWEKLWPIIRAERDKGGSRKSYQEHFEYLVVRLRRSRASTSSGQ